MELDVIRHRLVRRMENEGLSLRDVGELTGVSFSTLSRFQREKGEVTYKNARRIKAWLDNDEIPAQKPICTRRFKVGPLTFLVTVELVNAR